MKRIMSVVLGLLAVMVMSVLFGMKNQVNELIQMPVAVHQVDSVLADPAVFDPAIAEKSWISEEEIAAEPNLTIRNLARFIRASGQSIEVYLNQFSETVADDQLIVTIGEAFDKNGFAFGTSQLGQEGIVGCLVEGDETVCYSTADVTQAATPAQIKATINEMLADDD